MQRAILLFILILFGISIQIHAQKTKYEISIVTCVESLVPNGLGRSRMFDTPVKVNYLDFTTKQTASKKDSNRSKRKNIRLKDYEETKLLNLYNEGGIRFQNIASNDALMTSKINAMLSEGWELFFVSTGIESKMINPSVKKELLKMGLKILLDDDNTDENPEDPNGLFMTRYYFRMKVQ